MTSDTDKHKSQTWAPGLNPGRIEGLTDGTIAIIMTILVLELPAPILFETVAHAEHPTSFLEMWDEFYIYILGFLVLGIYWTLHHYMFHFIKRSDGVLMWLNILFLIFAALVPFSAKVLSVNEALFATPESEMNSASIFFTVTTIASIMTLFTMWQYATRGHRLVNPDLEKSIVSGFSQVILVGTAINLIGVLLSLFVPIAGYIAFIALVYMIFMTARGKFGIGAGQSK
jgi:uncharacterized membrane protein